MEARNNADKSERRSAPKAVPPRDHRVAIYIPAYNAEKQIISVLDRIAKTYGEDKIKILVVDNASTDKTSGVIKAYTEKNGLTQIDVIRNPENRGYGGSQKIGYRTCMTGVTTSQPWFTPMANMPPNFSPTC